MFRRPDDIPLCSWWDVAEGYEPIPKHSTTHGEYWLDEEYYLAQVPYYADLTFVQPRKSTGTNGSRIDHQDITIPSSYSVIQALIGVGQALWAIITIYQARGDQIQQYGYAAFGLTVVPYAFMSVTNAMANLLTPQYSTILVIRTPEMTEAEQQGKAFFKAAIDVHLLPVTASALPSEWTPVVQHYLPLLLGGVPMAIVGGLSRFQANNSTSLQRGFTMAWLAVGILFGCIIHSMNPSPDNEVEKNEKKKVKGTIGNSNRAPRSIKRFFKQNFKRYIKQYVIEDAACEGSAPDGSVLVLTILCSPPVIGGMVIVGLMIKEYGNCSLIG